MKKILSYLGLSTGLCCLAALPGYAQMDWHPTAYVGAGATVPTVPFTNRVNMGWDISAGAGVTNKHEGLMLDFTYNDFGINQNFTRQAGATGGSTRIWAFTLDPVVHLASEGAVDFYVTAGGGIYNRTVDFNNPGSATTANFDPWFGFSGPAGSAVGTSYTTYHGGVDGGAGVAIRLGTSRLKLFGEARYHYMFDRNMNYSFIPVVVGLRW